MIAIKVFLLITLPVIVLFGGAKLMNEMSGRRTVELQKPLFQRLSYNVAAVQSYWTELKDIDKNALENEKVFLKLDLFFPFFYGGAFSASLLMLWIMLDKPISLIWLLMPVAIAITADWTENIIQLGQIQLFMGDQELQPDQVQIASISTFIKIMSIVASSLLLLGLSVCLIIK